MICCQDLYMKSILIYSFILTMLINNSIGTALFHHLKLGISLEFQNQCHALHFHSLFLFSFHASFAASIKKLPLPAPSPVSFAFDLAGEGPYTGIADGRIIKYQGPNVGFVDYGYTAPNRNKTFCDGTNITYLAPICGRPLDAALGLVKSGPKGGAAIQLATIAGGVPIRFPAGMDVDQPTGIVYFTDASIVYNLSQIDQLIRTKDATGRLLKYEPKTKNVTVLLRGLGGASGVAISRDGSYLLVSEFVNARIQKYWLKGPKANTAEVLLNITGSPDKIRRTIRGDFWVAVTVQTPTLALKGLRINGVGTILEDVTFRPQFTNPMITEVNEHKGVLYLGTLCLLFVGVFIG